jgi:hypothetical protein
MRRTQEERQAEAARAQQMTEQAQQRVQDKKTGEFYDPKEAFDTMMNKPEIQAMLKRLAVR